MSNMHRIAWLDSRIRSERYPDCREMAEKFEISVRQAQRDIEYLKYTMGAPLEYSAAKRGYYYKDKTFILPSAMISDEEKQMLSYMANRYKITGGTDARRLAGLFERLVAGEGNADIEYRNLPILQVRADEARHYTVLCEALKKLTKVEMIYENNEGGISNRIFQPYTIFNREKTAYVCGFCELRKEIRVFRISRIQKLVLQNETYEIPSSYLGNYYEQGLGFFSREPYTALIEMEQLPGTYSASLRMEHVEGLIYRFYFYSSEEIINLLLTQKYNFRILSPNWLMDKLQQRLEKIIRINFNNDNICRTPPL